MAIRKLSLSELKAPNGASTRNHLQEKIPLAFCHTSLVFITSADIVVVDSKILIKPAQVTRQSISTKSFHGLVKMKNRSVHMCNKYLFMRMKDSRCMKEKNMSGLEDI